MNKLYTAVGKRKNSKLCFFFGISDNIDEISRNLSEADELKNYHIAELNVQIMKVIPNNKTYHWVEEK